MKTLAESILSADAGLDTMEIDNFLYTISKYIGVENKSSNDFWNTEILPSLKNLESYHNPQSKAAFKAKKYIKMVVDYTYNNVSFVRYKTPSKNEIYKFVYAQISHYLNAYGPKEKPSGPCQGDIYYLPAHYWEKIVDMKKSH